MNPHGRRDRPTELMDRFAERDALGRLTEAVRAAQGRALVLRGDPGVGKTALLSHLDRQASAAGCRVAHAMGISVQASAPTVEAGLAEFGGRVRFRHPLTRSAAYRSASLAQRQQMHAALAEVTDPITDPDRRAWHRAQSGEDRQPA